MVRYAKPRNAKLTVLVPQSVLDDLRALRTATFQSTGDLINQLIESELDRQQATVKEGYELLKIQDARKEKAMQRNAAAKGSPVNPSKDSGSETIPNDSIKGTRPSASDIDEWSTLAKSPDEVNKRRTDAVDYLDWVVSKEESINEDSASNYYETVLLSRYKERTAKNHRTHIVSFIRWWNAKLCS